MSVTINGQPPSDPQKADFQTAFGVAPKGTGTGGAITKADVGLPLVDNTADANKPVSGPQATAIGAKYTKPGTGIPATDLDAAAQAALTAAGTAVQPGSLGSAATHAATDFATAAQGTKADNAVPLAPINVTGSRALLATDAGATLVNNGAGSYALLLIPGLGRITLEQASTGALSVVLGSATTLTGSTFTTVFQSRVTLIEQSPGNYHGEYESSPLLPIQASLAALNSAYPAANNVGRTVQVGTAAPYKTYRSNGVTWLSYSDFVDPFTTGATESLLAAISAGSTVTPVYFVPGATYIATGDWVVDVYKVACMIGSGTVVDGSGLPAWRGMVFDYVSSASVGTEIRKSKTRWYEGLELIGPGKTASGSAGIWVHGSVAKNSPQPSLRNMYVHEFETLIGGRDSFYLVDVINSHFYNGTYGLWQQAGIDSGENCSMAGGLFDQCFCFIRVDDPSSEWTFSRMSFDYGRQLLVVVNTAQITFDSCHIECRGKNLVSDNLNYILDGSGSDTRAAFQALDTTVNGARFTWVPQSSQTGVAITLNVGGSGAIAVKTAALGNPTLTSGVPVELVRDTANNAYIVQAARTMGNIPCLSNAAGTTTCTADAIITRDCFFDADGDGTTVRFKNGCNFNVNASGGAGPYSMRRYAKARNAGTLIDFDGVYKENDLNYADHFWDGPGRVICGFITRTNSNPSNIVLHNRLSKYNLAANPDMTVTTIDTTTGANVVNNLKTVLSGGDLQVLRLDLYQNWWISKGRAGNQPANRFSDVSNYSAGRDGGTQPGLSTTGNMTIGVSQPSVGNATASAWSISGEVLTVTTMSGTTPFARDMILAGTGVTAGTRIIGPLDAASQAGLAGSYLIDTLHGTVAGSGNLTGTIGNAVLLSKYNTETSGFLASATASFAVAMTPRRIAAAKLLMLLPTTGGLAGGTVNVTSKYARISRDLDANGCPVILERFTQIRFKTWTLSSMTKDTWQETILDAWATAADCPPGANAYLLDFDLSTNGTPGGILVARPRFDYR